ncbi:medium-chain fatty acid ethyl ester synthase/esterase NDAI_0C05710 [Naumovozyma dairenensis CBS 421]|uniref:alcohol O-acetyltransferase n=1 Tax=Naumovozyma dairenensis (strain ATCC 10597 / BCRC 20456 / CBS 421 / NBRC 0211 / NRRL Y-12639) TaxID=1071378 RepID=G0W8W9_NAUDC|nr:hypothetical protein NDAI_0C05710 [Naumovozyma dairenensis CBS 421]CCD24230.1 hypothetical protein NDAI_0C05710 [Naumovozyma dairenensis CBS 421]
MSQISRYPLIKPWNWGYHGTVTQITSKDGSIEIPLKEKNKSIPLDEFVSEYVPALKDQAKFELKPYLFTGILQTIYLSAADFSKKFPVFYGREIVEFSDKGVCTADWVMPAWETKYQLNKETASFDKVNFNKDEVETHPEGWPRLQPRTRYLTESELASVHQDDRPLVVCCHGLAGGSHEPIIRSLTQNLTRSGRFEVVVLNTRGCARSKITTRNLFTAFHTMDLREFVNKEHAKTPNRKIYAVGFSFGATMLANYLGEEGEKTPITAAAVLCNPWDMVQSGIKTSDDFWTKNIFSKKIVDFLTRVVKVNMAELEVPEGSKPDHTPTVKNPSYYTFTRSNLEKGKDFQYISDFDDIFTAPALGFKSALEYYAAAGSIHRLPDIKVPLLVMNSTDDPVVGSDPIPDHVIDSNKHLLLCETDIGGHLAYLDKNDDSWSTKQISDFFEKFDEYAL